MQGESNLPCGRPIAETLTERNLCDRHHKAEYVARVQVKLDNLEEL
jgi:hypothetical protein